MHRIQFPVMGTIATLRIDGLDQTRAASLAADAKCLLARLERLFTRFSSTSDVARLRTGAWVDVDPRTAEVLTAAEWARRATDGAFDVTLGGGGVQPGRGEAWRCRPGVPLDLGGIAKGYAADAVRELCAASGASGALISLGTSSIAVHGRPAPEDGLAPAPWRIGLRAPGYGPDRVFGSVALTAGALSTSGDYLRSDDPARPPAPARPLPGRPDARSRAQVPGDGNNRHRPIVDPRTGLLAASGVLSATVMATDGMVAEALSTAGVVLGASGLMAVLDRMEGVEAVVVTDAAVLTTPGMRGSFALRQG
jgi:thiamine biosynthesis lipoprotein ApbE